MKNMIQNLIPLLCLALAIGTPAAASYVIPNGAVTTAKLADGAVTQAKRAALGQQISASSGEVTLSTACTVPADNAYEDIPNLSVTMTTTGRPVVFMLIAPDYSGMGSGSGIMLASSAVNIVLRESSTIKQQIQISSGSITAEYAPGAFQFFLVPTAGTHTYKVSACFSGGAAYIEHVRLIAYEL